MSSPVLVQMALRQASCDEPDPFPPKAITVDGPPPPSWGPKTFLRASLVPPGPLPTSPVRSEAPRSIFGRRVPRGGGGLCGLGAALQWTSCCFLGQQTLAQRARRPWLARVARRRTCAEGTTRPPAKPGLLLASVSTDASALFFSCVFCASSFFLLAPRNRCRSRWHSIGLPSWPFCSIGLRSRRPRRAQHRPTDAAHSAAYFFLGPRQDGSSWRCTARGPVGEAYGDIIN